MIALASSARLARILRLYLSTASFQLIDKKLHMASLGFEVEGRMSNLSCAARQGHVSGAAAPPLAKADR